MFPIVSGTSFLFRLPTCQLAVLLVFASLLQTQISTARAQQQRTEPPQQPPASAQALEQLERHIEDVKAALEKMRERIAANDPKVVEAQKELTALLELQHRALKLTQEGVDKQKKAEVAKAADQFGVATSRLLLESWLQGKPEQAAQLTQVALMKQQLVEREKQLAEREKQAAALAKQLAEEHRGQPLPPLENGTVKIYRFMYANPRNAAAMVESLFGTQVLRVAVDDRTGTLLAYGKPDVITALDALMDRFDQQASPDGYKASTEGTAAPRSLLLRVFWLADGLPDGEGQNPADFLPESVLEATEKLGLQSPRLVTQTVNALATGRDESVEFSNQVPAMLLQQPVHLACHGRLKLVPDNRVRLDLGVRVEGPGVNCELNGSLASPFGHYMVLGTATSILPEGGLAAGPGEPSMPRFAGPDGGLGPPVPGRVAPGAPGPAPEAREVARAPQPKPNFHTSRFAFVVQVNEGQSYAAKNANPDAE